MIRQIVTHRRNGYEIGNQFGEFAQAPTGDNARQ